MKTKTPRTPPAVTRATERNGLHLSPAGPLPQILTDRERFVQALLTGPLLKADAIVLLTGDGTGRIPVAVELFKQGAAPQIVVTGGLDNPPHSLPADSFSALLMSAGIGLDKIIVENISQNTREQAEAVIQMAVSKNWRRLLLVASPYHVPRAFLTFLKSLKERGKSGEVYIVPVPTSNLSWWEKPDGVEWTRCELLDDEFGKIEEYGKKGHVASYADGLDYLRLWSGK